MFTHDHAENVVVFSVEFASGGAVEIAAVRCELEPDLRLGRFAFGTMPGKRGVSGFEAARAMSGKASAPKPQAAR